MASALFQRARAALEAHPTLRPGDRIVAAMSGGVDSSVMAALLHRSGYQVVGISMHLFDKGDTPAGGGRCCTLDDVQDARRVAQEQGFPHFVMGFEDAFRGRVIEPFIQAYLDGVTPSPCILCNQHLKFSGLLLRARELGAAFVATGHYARAAWDGSRWRLHRAEDPEKDQSYFLFHHTQATLARTLFPLAGFTKAEVRQLGAELGLHLADKSESQEVCFVTQDRYDAFIEAEGRAPDLGPGEIRHQDGRLLGHHRGHWRHTIGQRRGLGVSHSAPLYVVATDPATNTVVVGPESALRGWSLVAREASWVGPAPTGPFPCQARIRSRAPEAEARVEPLAGGRLRVTFTDPQRAIAPGQAVVFYQEGEVLGGAWIERDAGAGPQIPRI